jgi:hypothetical protein
MEVEMVVVVVEMEADLGDFARGKEVAKQEDQTT